MELRLRAIQADPHAFGSNSQREVDRPEEDWERWAAEASTGPWRCVFVAETDDGPKGMAAAYTPDHLSRVRYVVGMWVAPEVRSVGIGGQLLDAIVDWSVNAGAEELRLWVVETSDSARGFYSRKGFEETGRLQPLPSNPSRTETRMVLRLSSLAAD